MNGGDRRQGRIRARFTGLAARVRTTTPFARLWAAATSSNLADGTLLAAGPLLAAALTRDPARVAALTTAQRLPWFLFSLLSGALVDRIERRRLLIVSNLLRGVVLGGVALYFYAGGGELLVLLCGFFVLGTVETVVDNAFTAILPSIVERERLESANGKLFTTQTISNEFMGPPLGSTLFSALAALPFGAAALFYSLAAVVLRRFPPDHPDEAGGSLDQFFASIKEGFRWFWNHHLIRTLAIIAGTANFAYSATFAIFVLLAQDRLGLSSAAFGLLLSSGAAGGLLGGVTAARIAARLGRKSTVVLMHLLPAVSLAGIALAERAWIVGGLLALISASATVANIVIISLRQAIIPAPLLGRVTSAYRLLALGALPSGALFGGLLARSLGLTAPFWMGAGLLAGAVIVLLRVLSEEDFAASATEG